ncbi:MAG: methyltransferase domain-containing protein [Thermoplasmatales archaeon]|nr:methyltransferase domain-containing protein [Thermoplasmatales archaeon]
MRKRDLEIALESVKPFEDPDPALEQYATPATMAADVLFRAYSVGDVAGKVVWDYGCGTGVFAIGAALLGASESHGIDVSPAAIAIARENAERLGVDVSFVQGDVSSAGGGDTVFMNPPFGCQNRNADRVFLEKAIACSESAYSFHMESTLGFVTDFVAARGKEAALVATYKYYIPHTFTFHRRTKQGIDVAVVNIR